MGLISATTGEPAVSPRSVTASRVTAAVSTPPSTVTVTVAISPPRATQPTVPGTWLRLGQPPHPLGGARDLLFVGLGNLFVDGLLLAATYALVTRPARAARRPTGKGQQKFG